MNVILNFSQSDNNNKTDNDLENLVYFYNNLTVAEKMCSKDVQDNLVDCLNEDISQDLVERCLSYCEEMFEYKPDKYDELKMPLKPM
jgi:ethanolamine utilization cobalamin adenosyltransferase